MAITTIQLSDAGKRFNFEWILHHVTYSFQSGKSYAILGPNGSGKSTLLQMIAGIITPSAGNVSYSNGTLKVDEESVFQHIGFAAPYSELIEEFTPTEMISFHRKFKNYLKGISENDVLKIARLEGDSTKQIRHFSSGMKQRLKVSLAMLSDVPVILLDEPTTNLDQQGFDWYLEMMKTYSNERIIIISSNLDREYSFCEDVIDVRSFKK